MHFRIYYLFGYLKKDTVYLRWFCTLIQMLNIRDQNYDVNPSWTQMSFIDSLNLIDLISCITFQYSNDKKRQTFLLSPVGACTQVLFHYVAVHNYLRPYF
jgi:hypothetical protein